MKLTQAGIDLIKKSEGCRLDAYLDAVGYLTVGYGHRTSSMKVGDRITQHQAEAIFESDIEKFSTGVENLCKTLPLTDNQFSACVSLAYNIGITRFASSTLFKKLKAGDFGAAAREFMKWDLAKGKVLPGLVARRAAEKALFLTP